jgi:hypothetical protein
MGTFRWFGGLGSLLVALASSVRARGRSMRGSPHTAEGRRA